MSKLVGYKTVSPDLKSFYDDSFKFEVGVPRNVKLSKADQQRYGNASCGVGLHFSPTPEQAIAFANYHNYKLFHVESDTKYLLGKDHKKYRVSQLTLTKEVDLKALELEKAKLEVSFNKSVANFEKNFLQPKKRVTKQKIVANLTSWFKQTERKGKLKIHFVDNFFEAKHYAGNALEWSEDTQDLANRIPLKDHPFDDSDSFIEAADMFLGNYRFNFMRLRDPKGLDKILELLHLGMLPILVHEMDRNATVVLYAPKTSIYKLKFL